MTHAQLLIAVIMLQQSMLAGVWVGAVWLHIARRPVRHWMAAALLTAAAMALMLMRGHASPWLTVVGANLLLITAMVAMRRGVRLFAHQPAGDLEHVLVLGASAIVLVGAGVLDAGMRVVQMGVHLALAWTLLRCAFEIRKYLTPEFGKAAARVCAGPMALVGAGFVWSAVQGPLGSESLANSIHEAGAANTAVMFFSMALGLLLNGALMALVFTRIVRRLKYLSEHDALTSLLGRRPMERKVHAEMRRAGTHKRSFALLSVDVDHFKNINDRLGHAVGDEVLVRVAHALRNQLRRSDRIARMGGEEFCVLLRGADLAQARQTAQRLLQAVRDLQHPGVDGGLQVTVSIGLAVSRSEPEPPADLLLRADRALYAAKRAGRDRVVEADAQEPGLPAPVAPAAPARHNEPARDEEAELA